MTAAQVAEQLGVSRHTVYRWISEKYLPACKLGNEVRINERDLKEFLKVKARRTDR